MSNTNDDLRLECNPGIFERTSTTTCTVTSTQQFTVTDWRFSSASLAQPIVRAGPVQDPTWTGKVVLDGTVSVTADVTGGIGGSQTVTVPIDVTNRATNWNIFIPNQRPLVADNILRPLLQYPPTIFHHLGWIELDSSGPDLLASGDPELIVDQGPNDFLYYSPVALPIPTFSVWVNPGLTPGDPWYAFHQGQAVPNSNGAQHYCTPIQLNKVAADVQAHEGVTPHPLGNSHYDVYAIAMQSRDFNVEIDSLVMPAAFAELRNPQQPEQVFYDSLMSLYNGFVRQLDSDPAQAAVDAQGSPTRLQVPCRTKTIP